MMALSLLVGFFSPPAATGHQAEPSLATEGQARNLSPAGWLADVAASTPELLWLERMMYVPPSIFIEGRAFDTNAIARFVENLDRMDGLPAPTLLNAAEEPEHVFRFRIRLHGEGLAGDEPASIPGRVAPGSRIVEDVRALLDEARTAVMAFGLRDSEHTLLLQLRIPYGDLISFFDRLGQVARTARLELMDLAAGGSDETRITAILLFANLTARDDGEAPPEIAAGAPASPDTVPSQPFRREPAGNPFQRPPALPAGRLRPDGVPSLAIDDLELAATFRTSKGYVAEVHDRRLNKKFLLKAGDRVYDGHVLEITSVKIVFAQTEDDSGVGESRREVVLSLPSDQ